MSPTRRLKRLRRNRNRKTKRWFTGARARPRWSSGSAAARRRSRSSRRPGRSRATPAPLGPTSLARLTTGEWPRPHSPPTRLPACALHSLAARCLLCFAARTKHSAHSACALRWLSSTCMPMALRGSSTRMSVRCCLPGSCLLLPKVRIGSAHPLSAIIRSRHRNHTRPRHSSAFSHRRAIGWQGGAVRRWEPGRIDPVGEPGGEIGGGLAAYGEP